MTKELGLGGMIVSRPLEDKTDDRSKGNVVIIDATGGKKTVLEKLQALTGLSLTDPFMVQATLRVKRAEKKPTNKKQQVIRAVEEASGKPSTKSTTTGQSSEGDDFPF